MLQRRGTTAEWSAANPVLGDGEIGYDRTTGETRIGDGVTQWNALPPSQIYIPKSTLDTTYVARSLVDAAGDLLIGSADNTLVRLPKGTANQRLTTDGAGNLIWADLPVAANPFAVITALGDILVGSGPGAVARLPKGANGTTLTIDGAGNVVWQAASAVDGTKVLKTGDAMTGELKMRSGVGVRLSNGAADAGTDPVLANSSGKVYIRQAGGGYPILDVGAVYDTGNRVYSPSNPPPAGGASILQTIRGYGDPGTTTVTIPSVNMAKAQLRHLGTATSSAYPTGVRLISSTQVQCIGVSGNPGPSYEVTEWS